MSSTDTPTTTDISEGPLPGAREFPEVVDGWTRSEPWVTCMVGTGIAGDYARGHGLMTYYEKVMDDGRVVAVETLTYMEVRPGEDDADEFPEAELFLSERDFFHTAPTREKFADQWFDVEDYEQTDLEFGYPWPTLHDGEVDPDDNLRMLREADRDDRGCLLWDGSPIKR